MNHPATSLVTLMNVIMVNYLVTLSSIVYFSACVCTEIEMCRRFLVYFEPLEYIYIYIHF